MEAASFSPPAALLAPRGGRLLRLRTDDQLVALFRFGNDDAFRVIHDRYRVRLLAYTRQMLAGSRADAEDALQDVFLRAYGALRADDRPVTLRAWLYRVAHNRCVDHMRRPANQPTSELFENVRSFEDPTNEAEQREDLARLISDVQRLPEQQRSALLMRELEGLSYAELGDALNVTIPSVKSLLVRARIGLTEAREARDTACVEIREGIADAHDRGVRITGRVRRHLRDCDGCREYHGRLRCVREGFAVLGGGATGFAALAKLIGLGGSGAAAGSGGGAAAGSGAVAGTVAGGSAAGGPALAGSLLAVTGTKVVALVGAAAVVGGGAVEASRELTRPAPAAHAVHRAPPPAGFAPSLVARAPGGPARLVRIALPAAPAAVRPKAKPAKGASVGVAVAAPRTTVPAADAAPRIAAPDTAPADPAVAQAAAAGGMLAPDSAPDVAAATPTATAAAGAGRQGTSTSDSTTTSSTAPATAANASPAAPSTGTTGPG